MGRKKSRSVSRRLLKKSEAVDKRRMSAVEPLEPRAMLAGDPVLSEFQASNVNTILDGNGRSSDWIEIRNPEVEAINVGGWYLSNDELDLKQWQFPANTTLEPGEIIVVFASGENEADPDGNLHTNFKLDRDGEFLALVKPDGTTVTQSFNPYPAQLEDQSFGLAVSRDVKELIPDDAAINVHVPGNNDLGTGWTATEFDDSSWTSGTTGVGFEDLYSAFTEADEFDAPLGPEWTTDIPDGGASTVEITGGNLVMTVPEGQDTRHSSRGLAPIVYREIPGDGPIDWEFTTHVTQGEDDEGRAGIGIYDASNGKLVISLEYSIDDDKIIFTSGGVEVDTDRERNKDNYALKLVRDNIAKTWSAFFKTNLAGDWKAVGVATDGIDSSPYISQPRAALFARTPTSTITATFDRVEFSIADQRPIYPINLDVKDSMMNQNSSIYMRIPFELNESPARFDELDLTTMSDDGYRAFLNGVEITAQNVPIDSTWNSEASSTRGAVNGVIPVDSIFAAASLGALREGSNVLAIQGMNVNASDPDFFFHATLSTAEILSESLQPFIQPTPGELNLLPAAPTPVITGESGLFFGSQTIELSVDNPNPNLEIRYTLDGSNPTANSSLYNGPIVLNESARLEAKTFDSSANPNFVASNAASGTYFALADDLRETDSNLPIIILDTLGKGVPSTGSTSLVGMNVAVLEVSKATGRASIDGAIVDYLGRGGARSRGSSTGGQPKHNMSFETWGTSGTTADDDTDVAFLGMSPESDWVLHAPYDFDRALIRNQLAFDVSNQMGQWAPDYRPAEVYLNKGDGVVSADDYFGVYAVLEKIKQGGDRVDIAGIDPSVTKAPDDPSLEEGEPNISGGYMFKVDRADPDAPAFSAGRQSLNWVTPKSPGSRTARPDQKATSTQQQWITDYLNDFADTLSNPDINDPEGYSKYINPISWVDTHLVNVWMMNVDALRLSAYMHKDRDAPMDYGPIWDFDRSAESTDGRDDDPYVWRSEVPDFGTDFFGNGTQRWWGDLFRDPGFWQLYVDRWQMYRNTMLSDDGINETINRLADPLTEAQARNFTKWRGTRPRTNSNFGSGKLNGTWQGEVENMRQWLLERAGFMDANFVGQPLFDIGGEQLSANAEGELLSPGTEVNVSAAPLTFYNDTVLLSGEVGASTASYLIPTDNSLGADWAAPNFDDGQWTSGPLGLGFDSGDDFLDLIGTVIPKPDDVKDGGTTVLSRMEFNLADASSAKSEDLILRMKYDDGFVAYLNGTEIWRQNIRDNDLAWDSRGTSHRDSEAVVFEDFDISEFSNLLVDGRNVLAIRGVNSTSGSNDMLMLPELVSREVNFGVNPNAKVYYTTDGTDPRGLDGTPTASSQLMPQGGALTINEDVRIVARAFDDATDRGPEARIVKTDWSGPLQYDFFVADSPLVISEVNYNPAGDDADNSPYNNDDFEFIEIHNPSAAAASLLGVKLADGVEFDFFDASTSSIAPGGYAIVASNTAAFAARYGNSDAVIGVFDGSLDNTGEDVDLVDGTGATIFSLNYNDSDPWSIRADGFGATLELIDPNNTPAERQNKWYSWRGSSENGGSPGTAGVGPAGVVVNEVLAGTRDPVNLSDSIELHNVTAAAIDISGWRLSDAGGSPDKFTIPNGTLLPAGGYVVFDESDFNADNPVNGNDGFALNGVEGDNVWLTQADGSFVDDVHFRETINGESLGRVPNGSGRLAPLSVLSLGAENVSPRVGPIVISSVQYNPRASSLALEQDPSLETSDLEYVQIHNPTGADVSLNDWRIRGGVEFSFEDGTTIAAGETITILKFDPTDPENINQVNAFKVHYAVADGERLLGGYAGQLSNSDDRITLLRPIAPPANQPNESPRVLEDEVLYDDLAPWPSQADGTGRALVRVTMNAFGNAASSWVAGDLPASLAGELPGDFDGNGVVNQDDINLLFVEIRSQNNNAQFDLTADGLVNNADRDEMVNTILGTDFGDSNLDGLFNSGDLVIVFQAGEYEDATSGNSLWETGDWDGDGDFGSGDLVLAFQSGAYTTGAVDPTSVNLQLVGAAITQTTASDDQKVQTLANTQTVNPGANPLGNVRVVDASVESLFEAGNRDESKNSIIEDAAEALVDDGLSF